MIIPEYLYHLTFAYVLIFIIREIVSYKKILIMKYFFTPLITVSAVFIALIAINFNGLTNYNLLIFTSLLMALVADTLLMIEEVSFIKNGIIFFTLGHIFYAVAFCTDISFRSWNIILIAVIAIINFIHLKLMKKYAGRMFIPVVFYIVVIDIMGFLAITKLNNGEGPYEITVASAAIMFWISDLILSINTFVKKIPHSTIYTWLFYAPAQLLFAWSAILINRV